MPICTHKHDARSLRCRTCSGIHKRGTSYGKAKDWHLNTAGYLYKCINGIGILQHRYIMEQHLGRKLGSKEHVHHINGVRTDNRLENLEVLSASEHGREHMTPRAKEMSLLGHLARWGLHVSNI